MTTLLEGADGANALARPRIALRALTPADVDALLAPPGPAAAAAQGGERRGGGTGTGVVPDEVLRAARQRHRGGCAWFWSAPCLFVEKATGEVVGCASFLDADTPEENTVEIGYGIVDACQGRGLASRGVALMLARAFAAQPDIVVIARTAISNRGSQRVLEKNGFIPWGHAHDPAEGPLIVWRRAREGLGQ